MNYEEYLDIKGKLHAYLIDTGWQRHMQVSDNVLNKVEDYLLTLVQFDNSYHRSSYIYIIGYSIKIISRFISNLFSGRNFGDITSTQKKIIFISARTLYNRFARVCSSLENCSVVYMPDINLEYIKEHFKEHLTLKNSVFEITYKLRDVLHILFDYTLLLPLIWHMRKKAEESLSGLHIEGLLMLFTLKFIAESETIKSYFHDDNAVFILDYDKSINLLVLIHHREKYGLKFKVGSINHGAFAGFNLAYVCPSADFSMCTCEREVRITMRYAMGLNLKIKAVGAPLQSFIENKNIIKKNHKEDSFLILGTLAEGEWLTKQRDLILELRTNSIQFKYRPRPASKLYDLKALSNVLTEDDCTHDTTLDEDCSAFDTIISFSLDALGSCVRLNKELLVFVTSFVYDNFSPIESPTNQIVITSKLEDVMNFIKKTHKHEKYSVNTIQWIENNIGIQEYDHVVNNISNFINLNI